MKNRIRLVLLFLLVASYISIGQTVNIDLNSEKQIIKGFGGINHPIWYSDLNANERQLCYENDDGQLGFTVLRVYVSDNPNDWSRGLETAQHAYNQGALVFASPWNPPASMTYTDNAGQKHIDPNSFSAYAKHLNDFVTFMRNNGVELYAISTQNEPDYAHDWTEWTPQQSVDFIKGYADQIDCRIMTPESFQYRKNVYDPFLNDAEALSKVDIFGTHLYGTQYSDFPYPLFEQKGAGKELWMTEVYTDSKYDANIWSDNVIDQNYHALKVAEHIHYAMVDGQFQTYVFWPLRRYYALIHDGATDQHESSPAAAGTITKRGYCMGQFSKWIRPGFVRVEATKSPANNVFFSAYKKDSEVVIVAVNKTTSSKTVTINLPGIGTTTFEQYTTSSSKNLSKGNNINGGNSFQVTLDPSSVTTFVGGSSLPEVSLVYPSLDTAVIIPQDIYLEAEVSDPDAIQTLKFFVNGEQVGTTEWVAPYFTHVTIDQAGTYQVYAEIEDANGNTKTSPIRTITAHVPQSAYTGSPHIIPGLIEVEEYDLGGNNFAYFDDSKGSETGVNFRTQEDVDIEECTDVGGGYNLGWATSGEWLEYTVDVQSASHYDIDFRVACNGDNRTLSLQLDGEPLVTEVVIPNTTGWQEWQTVTVEDVALSEGEQVLRLIVGNEDYVNINYVAFKSFVTGDGQTIDQALHVYPNPFNSEFKISLNGTFEYKITNTSGVVVEYASGVDSKNVGSTLEKGLYFLIVHNESGKTVQQLIKL